VKKILIFVPITIAILLIGPFVLFNESTQVTISNPIAAFGLSNPPVVVSNNSIQIDDQTAFVPVEGNMVMRVYNSESKLVSYVISKNLEVRNNGIMDIYSSSWPIVDIISKDGQDYNVHLYQNERPITYDQTMGFFVITYYDSLVFTGKHPQINVVVGDVGFYEVRILQPVL